MQILGTTFGKLTVEAYAPRFGKLSASTVIARCVCGQQRKCTIRDLRAGRCTSCGNATCRVKSMLKHGQCTTPTYRSWLSMWQRCTNVKHSKFAVYGGKGISVCARWGDFAVFRDDVGDKPTRAHTLDRIDGTKGYSPDNVRWATPMQQSANLRSNKWLTRGAVTHHSAQWARILGISNSTICRRLKAGATDEEALRPVPEHRRRPNNGRRAANA